METNGNMMNDREIAIKRIRKALKSRSGLTWSVKGGRGTSWGWITIAAPPKRETEDGYISEMDRSRLKALLDLETVHQQGVSIPSSGAYRDEYIARAEGRTPTVHGEPYWD